MPELTYVGEHGLELAPEADAWADRMAGLRRRRGAPRRAEAPDGLVALAHVLRRGRRPSRELEQLADRAVAAGLVPRFGRKVLEVRPPVDADKGTAVSALLAAAGADRALYAGDDTTDLDAFRAPRRSRARGPSRRRLPGVPARLREAADLVVAGPAGLLELLRSL